MSRDLSGPKVTRVRRNAQKVRTLPLNDISDGCRGAALRDVLPTKFGNSRCTGVVLPCQQCETRVFNVSFEIWNVFFFLRILGIAERVGLRYVMVYFLFSDVFVALRLHVLKSLRCFKTTYSSCFRVAFVLMINDHVEINSYCQIFTVYTF